MKRYFLFLLFFLCSIVYTRSQKINGSVYYQNSGGKPAPGVQVSAFGCSSGYSNANGKFTLQCPNKKAGQKITPIIGSTDATGRSIETVNTHQLKWLRFSGSSKGDNIQIIVCPKGYRAKVAAKYYDILIKSTNKAYQTRLKEIKAQLAQKNLDAETTLGLINQMEKLRKERDKALERTEEQALSIASVNKDNASEIVKLALEKIEQGEDVEEALKILDSDTLKRDFELALKDKHKIEAEMSRLAESYELKIMLLSPRFKYKEMIDCYQEMINIYITNHFDKKKLADLYNEVALVMNKDRQYKEALEHQQKAIAIQEELFDPKHPSLAASYNNIGNIYRSLGEYQKALGFQKKALAIREEILDPNDPDMAKSYNNMGKIYLSLGECQKALKYQKKALIINEEELTPQHPDLATSYYDIGKTFYSMNQYKKALELQQKALTIRELVLPTTHPDLIKSYQAISKTNEALRIENYE